MRKYICKETKALELDALINLSSYKQSLEEVAWVLRANKLAGVTLFVRGTARI